MQQNYGPPPGATPWYPSLPPVVEPRTGKNGRGLAITGVVLASLALLGVLAVAIWVAVATDPGSQDGGGGPLTGQLPSVTAGKALAGSILAKAVTDRIDQDGGDVTRMDCPATPRVGQGVVTVCHGVISDSDYAVVVYFEDPEGRFTLEPV
jgi:hypothetical protein